MAIPTRNIPARALINAMIKATPARAPSPPERARATVNTDAATAAHSTHPHQEGKTEMTFWASLPQIEAECHHGALAKRIGPISQRRDSKMQTAYHLSQAIQHWYLVVLALNLRCDRQIQWKEVAENLPELVCPARNGRAFLSSNATKVLPSGENSGTMDALPQDSSTLGGGMANRNEDDRMQNVLHAYWILSTQTKLMRRFAEEIHREELSGVLHLSWVEAIQTKLMQRFPEEFSREELDEILISPLRLGHAIKSWSGAAA
jgi:hypothetical protein